MRTPDVTPTAEARAVPPADQSLRQRVERADQLLRHAVLASALLRGSAFALFVLLLATFADAAFALSADARMAVPLSALGVGLAEVLRRLRRRGWRAPADHAALWIESRFPSLRYAMVTAVDAQYGGAVPELERAAAQVPFEAEIRRVTLRALRWPALVVIVFVTVLAILPSGSVTRVTWPHAGDALDRPVLNARRVNPLETIVVRVSPPAYAHSVAQTVENPAVVRALVGSSVDIEGRGEAPLVRVVLAADTLTARVINGRWRIELPMLAASGAVRLLAGTHERLLALDPVRDSVPVLELTTPARDSILRSGVGRVPLTATVTDDIGLTSGAWELVVSSGAGENFTFRTSTIGATALSGKAATLTASLNLDALKLEPGDVLHLRAVARDGNTVSGVGMGASETRTWRMARADEYDSVAVDAAPPAEAEKNALSQRMLLMLAQALDRRRGSLAHNTFVNESRAIAVDQTRLRQRVGQIVFQRLGENEGEEGDAFQRRLDRPVNADSVLAAAARANDAAAAAAGAPIEGNSDETPVMAVSKPLLEAYNAMWLASSSLEIGEPRQAIPFMQKALDALQRARSAERIYLRGKSRAVVVDVARARMQGKERGIPTARTPRDAADPTRAARLARFDAAVRLAATAPLAAADTLLLLRIDLLERASAAGDALGAAANALRGSGNATSTLVMARRALVGVAPRRAALGTWGAPW